jgi:hypothetical protein
MGPRRRNSLVRSPSNNPNIRLIRQNALRSDGRDQADRRPHVACGQPGQDELRGPDRQRHGELVLKPHASLHVSDARGDGKEAADHVADDQHQHGDDETSPEAMDGMVTLG